MMRIRSTLLVLASCSLALGLAACGDDDDAPTDAGSAADADSVEADGGGADDGGGPVGASVTVDGTTYAAADERVCVRLGGALSAQFHDQEQGIEIHVDLPPEDWESDTAEDWDPPSVRVDVADDAQLESGRTDVVVGMPETDVSSYVIDGVHASGEGDFVDVFQAPDAAHVVAGSFEVTCAE